MKDLILIKYGEVALRKNNRRLFINQLILAIRRQLGDNGDYYITKEQGRLILENRAGSLDESFCVEKLQKIPGIVGIAPCIMTESSEMGHLQKTALSYMQKYYGDKPYSFKVAAKRANKQYPLTSTEIAALVGGYVLENMNNLVADMKKPDVALHVELRTNNFIYSQTYGGMGGLPAGSSGKGLCLLSGGLDSPVAAYLAAKRGVAVDFIYFHSPPYTSERAKQKVIDLAGKVAAYTGGGTLWVVPFTDVQLYLLKHVQEEKLTLFLKRAMLKIADGVAKKENAVCLITGDAIGQVASQTLHALHAVDSAATLPVIRPLSCFDKKEIIDLAKQIETYEISIRPYEDCCTIFVPRHPEIKPKRYILEKTEMKLPDLSGLLLEAGSKIETVVFY